MSRKRKMAAALLGAAALASMRGPQGITPMERRDIQKSKSRKKFRTTDSGAETMVGSKIPMSVDRDATPREIKEKADNIKKANTKIRKQVEKRRDDGDLSPTMPKRKNQISSDFGLNIMGGAKAGKMVKARGGGMARMKPTKLY